MTTSLSLLAATDLSAPSRHAAQRAAMLAREVGGKLDLVYVLGAGPLGELRQLLGDKSAEIEGKIQLQAQQALNQLTTDISELYGVSPGGHLAEGAVLASILNQANVLGVDLLVVGARGASFMRHWLLGATAERLLRKTHLPILVVKQAPHEAFKSVLIAVDFSPWSVSAIKLAQKLCPQAHLILLHACEVPFEGKMRYAGVDAATILHYRESIGQAAMARLHELAADRKLVADKWQPLVMHGDPAHCILEQEEEQAADLVVLGKHGQSMTEELLLGSVTKHVLSQTRADVLVIN